MGGWWLVACRRYGFLRPGALVGWGVEMTDVFVGTCAVEAG